MKCFSCNREFDGYTPYKNAEMYGCTVYAECPHCGKTYKFTKNTPVKMVEDIVFKRNSTK